MKIEVNIGVKLLFDVTVHPQNLSLCLVHRLKLNVSSRAPRSQTTSERQVTFLIDDPAQKNTVTVLIVHPSIYSTQEKIWKVRMSVKS